MRTSLATYLDDFASRGRETAFAQARGLRVARWSYGCLAKTAYRFARELDARGIVKGDRVLLWARNSPEWVAAFWGCLHRGAIVVPLDLQSDPGFVARVQAQVQARLALCECATAAAGGHGLPVVALEDLGSQLAHRSDEPYPRVAHASGDTAEIVFTSGTTAEPKGVCITHRNLLANLAPIEEEVRRFAAWERLVHPVRFLSLVPLSHVLGQFMGVFVPQLFGGEVHFLESLVPSQVVHTIRRERVTVLVCVPRMLETLREHVERDLARRGTLAAFRRRFDAAAGSHVARRWWTFRDVHRMFGWKCWAVISGGATLNPDVEEFWQRLGFAVIQGYGLTETASIVSVNYPGRKKHGSIGKVVPGQEVRLAENGEILVRGDNVSPGYWNAAPPAGGSGNGWFHTGDVGEIDADGNLFFRGRQKEVIVTSAGMNIYPEDIELALARQPEVRASAVVGIEGVHGPEPVAAVILRDGGASVRDAVDRANRLLASHQHVHRWVVWPDEDFPRTTTQKIRREAVARQVQAAVSPTPRARVAPPVAPAGGRLAEILGRVSGERVERLDRAATLGTDLKLDSLARVELVTALEESYRVHIDEAAFSEATTVGDLERVIRDGTHDEAPRYSYPRWQHGAAVNWLRVALLYTLVLPVTRIMGRPAIHGAARLHGVRGPLVFVCNHISLVDHALVMLALPGACRRRMAIAMDAETLHEWRHPPPATGVLTRACYLVQYALAMLFFNGFYLPQKSGFRTSFTRAGELMDRGYHLLVFPEGQRTKHGRLHPFMAGTGLLVSKLDAPVVPVRIDGLWDLKRAKRLLARPGEIAVTIGEPVRYSSRDAPEQIARDLEARVAALAAACPAE